MIREKNILFALSKKITGKIIKKKFCKKKKIKAGKKVFGERIFQKILMVHEKNILSPKTCYHKTFLTTRSQRGPKLTDNSQFHGNKNLSKCFHIFDKKRVEKFFLPKTGLNPHAGWIRLRYRHNQPRKSRKFL